MRHQGKREKFGKRKPLFTSTRTSRRELDFSSNIPHATIALREEEPQKVEEGGPTRVSEVLNSSWGEAKNTERGIQKANSFTPGGKKTSEAFPQN